MPEYEVTGTDERERLSQSGEPEKIYIVYLRTARGVRGTAEVKPADWNAESLREILSTRAAELNLAFNIMS